MSYTPAAVPSGLNPRLASWMAEEFRKISAHLAQPLEILELHAEPSKLYDGLTVVADGTDWDPGSGQGVYTYYASAWHKLG